MKYWKRFSPSFEADTVVESNSVGPWSGHKHFAYDLVRSIEPQKIVELGTHWGNSFFAFCQAVKDGGLETECYAVDHWAGEEHSGEYDENVFDTVSLLAADKYSRVNTKLLRMDFDEALDLFEDDSIDLLHIDGLHTYDAVKKDFLTWLPKIASNGIVLFHDVFPEVWYGSQDYWSEVSLEYPSVAFDHSWGLGILFPKGDTFFIEVFDEVFNEYHLDYKFRAGYELLSRQLSDTEKIICEKDLLVAKLESEIDLRDEQISISDRLIVELKEAFNSSETHVESLMQSYSDTEALVQERDKYIVELEERLNSAKK